MTILASLLLSTVTVTLPAQANVQGAEITLGEIAQIEGATPDELSRLKSFALGYAPTPGYSRVLQDWKIQSMLGRKFDTIDFAMEGSKACRIFPDVTTVKGSDLYAEARTAIDTLFTGDDVKIHAGAEIHDETVPAGSTSRVLLGRPALSTYASSLTRTGTWSVPVQIVIDGVPYRTVWVPFDVTIYRVMPVLKRDVPRGSTIQSGDVVMKRAAMQSQVSIVPLGERELLGAVAGRNLRMNEPILARDVTRAKAIRKGETVTLSVKNGTISVNAHVVALQDAYIGDMVAVQVVGSMKELTAEVVGKGRLKIDFATQ